MLPTSWDPKRVLLMIMMILKCLKKLLNKFKKLVGDPVHDWILHFASRSMQGVSKVSLSCDGYHMMAVKMKTVCAVKMKTMCNNKVKIRAKRKDEKNMKMIQFRNFVF